ncbi:unnamed protein product, partial [Mesorhabditis belari]|uniref:AdoMet activation domain-containing protein n=1 Tax=Mesorhabditis belari TaxID=2138241 RepID=A0AAF3J8A3_9BILA
MTPCEKIIQTAIDEKADFIGLSDLIIHHLMRWFMWQKKLIDEVIHYLDASKSVVAGFLADIDDDCADCSEKNITEGLKERRQETLLGNYAESIRNRICGYPRIFIDADVGSRQRKSFEDAKSLFKKMITEKSLRANAVIAFYECKSEGDINDLWLFENGAKKEILYGLRCSSNPVVNTINRICA